MNLLIAPWGSPWRNQCNPGAGFRWDEVTYVLDGNNVRSRTSLPLLLGTLKPKATLILVCDTVACLNDLNGKHEYASLVEAVRKKYEDFINYVLSNAGLAAYRSKVEVSVIPCFGNFSNGEFGTQAEDTRLWILYTLLKFLMKNLADTDWEDVSEEVTVTLDLTHGINYLPTLTYASLKVLLQHLAFIGRGSGKKIKLQVLNSDPFSKGVTNVLHVNRIEENIVHPSTEPHRFNSEVALRLKSCSGKPSDEEIEVIKELRRKHQGLQGQLNALSYLYASVHAGAPLATLTFMKDLDVDKLMKEVNEYFKDHLSKGFKVSVDTGKVKVVETLCLTHPAEFILEAMALLVAIRGSMKRKNIGAEPTLRNLNTIAEIIAWNQTLKEMTANELHNIKKIICEYILGPNQETTEKQPKHLDKCVEALEELEEGIDLKEIAIATGKKVGGFSPRNFLAHAGLEYNTIKVKATINLTYKEEQMKECKKTLKNQITLQK